MIKSISIYFISLIFCSCLTLKKNQFVIYLAGDSTMAAKEENRRPETGWGEQLSSFFGPEVRIENHAKNGRSSKSFIYEGLWDSLYTKLEKGDFVFIQFGHNDSSKSKGDRYSSPEEYRKNLVKYLLDTRAKHASPILFTPVVRRRFDENGQFYDTHGVYPDVVRSVAKEYKVPLIDLQQKTALMLIEFGETQSKELFLWVGKGHPNYPDGVEDNTHFSPVGAKKIADLTIEEILTQKLKVRRFLKKEYR
ncbi:MAG: rhamnogalacturonan acetylesterase [Saprospiraceae bacterium]|nr:rhamnogalacturonan acetylesterase [Saprospiraceae bacterium]